MSPENVPFEPTRSFCYRFARYQAIPEIMERPEVIDGKPFRLVEVARAVIDAHLTADQQSTMLKKAKSDAYTAISQIVKFFIYFIARGGGLLVPLGNGMFRVLDVEDAAEEELEEAADAQDDVAAGDDFDGNIYAFTFPALIVGSVYPIKVGMTVGNVEERVRSQCRGSAMFDHPKILKSWQVRRMGAVESAVHGVLKARGKWRSEIPGIEWFNTSIEEIDQIIGFVQKDQT